MRVFYCILVDTILYRTNYIYVHVPQPTGPGCQRKTPWCVHTNDPVNLGSGPEFWLQFANAVEFGENTVVILYCTYPPLFWLNGRFCADSQNVDRPVGWDMSEKPRKGGLA